MTWHTTCHVTLLALLPQLAALDPNRPQRFEPLLDTLSPPARCAIDLALWDWHGQRLGHPLWRLWGLDPAEGVATSVTLGLASVDAVLDRLERWWTQLPPVPPRLMHAAVPHHALRPLLRTRPVAAPSEA